MMRGSWYVCCLFVLISTLSSGQTKEIIVTPTLNSTNCSSVCLTLTEYARGDFSSHTILTFLDGYHTLHSEFTMTGLRNISLRALPGTNVTIDCDHQYGFVFQNIISLLVENIIFVSCGSSNESLDPGILLETTTESELNNVIIKDCDSTALLVVNSTLSFTNLALMNNELVVDSLSGEVAVLQFKASYASFAGTTTFSNNKINDTTTTISEDEKLKIYYNNTKVIFLAHHSSNVVIGGLLLVEDNYSPSGILRLETGAHKVTGISNFSRNSVLINGALALRDATLTYKGEAIFSQNSGSFLYVPPISSTGGLLLENSTAEMSGSISFIDNFADIPSLELKKSSLLLNGTLSNRDNRRVNPSPPRLPAYSTMLLKDSDIEVTGFCTFRNNRVTDATLRLEQSTLRCSGVNDFINNTGSVPCLSYGGGYTFLGNTIFESNSGVLYGVDSMTSFHGNSSFIRNNNPDSNFLQGTIKADGGSLQLRGLFTFLGNEARNGLNGGALYTSSTVTFEGNGEFIDNEARFGGAVYFENRGNLRVLANTSLLFQRNRAAKGAGMYLSRPVELKTRLERRLCNYGFAILPCFLTVNSDSSVRFLGNKASAGGSVFHIDVINDNAPIGTQSTFRVVFDENNTLPRFASDSFKLCFCVDGEVNCSIREMQVEAQRGGEFSISLASVTPYNNSDTRSVRSFIRVPNPDPKASRRLVGGYQTITENCTVLSYTLFSSEDSEVIAAKASDLCIDDDQCVTINVTFERCPDGFNFTKNSCVCEKSLEHYAKNCYVNTRAVEKMNNAWIGTHFDENSTYSGLILYDDCPFDFCISSPFNVSLDDPDTQCNNNRSGILCGGCREGFSLKLGTTKCVDECSSDAFLALLIVMALLGVLLVVSLFLLQLTVSSGTIHGLIFFANAVNINRVVFGLDDMYVFNVFINWLNLDFGIESCFHSNLTQLQYRAWQFVFPVYLGLIELFIIVICQCSLRASKLLAHGNPVSVLSTLVLLSYNKLVRAAAASLFIAHLEYPRNATNVASVVWRLDGNVEYGVGWHGALVLLSVLVLIILVSFTFLLLTSQWLYKSELISKFFHKYSVCIWLNSYHAPYKPHSRYWVGLCFSLRCLLLATFPFTESMATFNLLTTATICILLLAIIGISRGIYTNRWLNFLECIFITNLAILSVATIQVKFIDGYQLVLMYVSTGVALLVFLLMIIIYTAHRYRSYKKKRQMKVEREKQKNSSVKMKSLRKEEVPDSPGVTSQTISVADYNLQYREPIIGTPPAVDINSVL